MTNRRISHFELQELLGEGAMGRVYRALDLNLDRTVALKLLGDRTLGDPSFLDRFRREARLAAQLNHPNIATIYAFGEDQGEAYLAMEFVEGDTLEDLVKKQGPLPVADVRKYGRQAAAALAVAHKRGIVHRDIKTANLMITADGDLKVMDFGVARRSGETQLTMAGSLIGTANIMAPELVQGGEATPAADLFSLGCVLYELLAGRPAFDAPDAMATLYQVIHNEPDPLAGIRPDAPSQLVQVVEGLMIKDPQARFGPAEAVAAALASETAPPTGTGTAVLDPGAVGTLIMGPEAGGAVRDTLVGPPPAQAGTEHPAPGTPFWKRRPVWAAVAVAAAVVAAVLFYPRGPAPDRARAAELTKAGNDLVARFASSNPPDSTLLQSASGQFREATSADPHYALAWNNLGEVQRRLKDVVGAESSFKRAVKESSTYALAYSNLGMLYSATGDLKRAEPDLRKALDLDATLAVAHLGLADLLERTDRKTQAVEHYKQAAKSPNDFERLTADNNLGFLLVVLNKPDDAVDLLEPAVRNGLPVPSLWKNLGLAYLQLGREADADSAFTKAIRYRKAPYPQAEAGLAEARLDTTRALELWGNIEKENTDPANPDADPDQAEIARRALDRLQPPPQPDQ